MNIGKMWDAHDDCKVMEEVVDDDQEDEDIWAGI